MLPSLARLVFPPGKLPELSLGSAASFRLLQVLAKNFIDKASRERTVDPARGWGSTQGRGRWAHGWERGFVLPRGGRVVYTACRPNTRPPRLSRVPLGLQAIQFSLLPRYLTEQKCT